jgi:hypothetical protein
MDLCDINESMYVPQIKEVLKNHNVKFNSKLTKNELILLAHKIWWE